MFYNKEKRSRSLDSLQARRDEKSQGPRQKLAFAGLECRMVCLISHRRRK